MREASDLPRLGGGVRGLLVQEVIDELGEDCGSFEVDLVSGVGKKDAGSVGKRVLTSLARSCAGRSRPLHPRRPESGCPPKASNGGNARLCPMGFHAIRVTISRAPSHVTQQIHVGFVAERARCSSRGSWNPERGPFRPRSRSA